MAKDPPYADIGELLKAARMRLDLTQAEMADRLHRKQAQISKWESGAGLPPTKSVRDVARAYHVHPELLLPRRAAS